MPDAPHSENKRSLVAPHKNLVLLAWRVPARTVLNSRETIIRSSYYHTSSGGAFYNGGSSGNQSFYENSSGARSYR